MINNNSYQHFIPTDFSENSRVWIYQSSRLLTISEALQIEPLLENFVANWKSHGSTVKGFANLFFGQFIILMADETSCNVGGCSTDSSVHVIKQIERDLKIDFFNRENLAFIVKEKVEILPLQQINYALENGFINSETLYFNNLVATKKDLLNNWIIPIKESWLAARFKLSKNYFTSLN